MSEEKGNQPPSTSAQLTTAAVQLLGGIYSDLAKPGVVAVGQALATVLDTANALLLPMKLWKEKRQVTFKENLQKFEKELAEATAQGKKVIAVAPELGNPIVEKLTYITDEDLSALFLRLLRRASLEDEANLAHPRFVEIASNLSPDEARILSATCDRDFFRCISVRWEAEGVDQANIITKTYYTTDRFLTGLEDETLILFPQNIPKYLISMQSLGLITLHEDSTLDEAEIPLDEYDDLRRKYSPVAKDGMHAKGDYTSKVIHGRIQYTEFGDFFLQACVRSGLGRKDSAKRRPRKDATSRVTDLEVRRDHTVADRRRLQPISDELNKLRRSLDAALKNVAKSNKVPSEGSILRVAKTLADMKYIAKSDYSEVKDFASVIQDIDTGFGVDEESISWAVRFIPMLVTRLNHHTSTDTSGG